MDENEDEGWYRRNVGRRLERGVNRVVGTFLLLIAAYAGFVTLTTENFSLAMHWPGLAVAALFGFLGRLCFRAKDCVIDDWDGDGDLWVPPDRKRP